MSCMISECSLSDIVLHTSAVMQGLRVKGSPHWSAAIARSTILPYSPVESASHTQSPISPRTATRQKTNKESQRETDKERVSLVTTKES